MKKITFIINPISGHGKKQIVEQAIKQYLRTDVNIDILYTNAPKHAIQLSKEACSSSDIIVAVGGDGSIHEVAQSLVDTNVKLGVIPMGSGNGLARHLQIPLNVKKSIELINQDHHRKIDVLDFGGIYGINVSGIGFDAHIAHEFASYGKRGFVSYIKLSIKEFLHYRSQLYRIKTHDKTFETTAFLISIANSSQFGNNAYISPKAEIDDGLFDLAILSPFRKRESLNIGIKLFTKRIDQSHLIDIIKTNNIELSSQLPFPLHIDGEDMGIKKELNVKTKPLSLNIIVPKT